MKAKGSIRKGKDRSPRLHDPRISGCMRETTKVGRCLLSSGQDDPAMRFQMSQMQVSLDALAPEQSLNFLRSCVPPYVRCQAGARQALWLLSFFFKLYR